jgi:hypothetical protein
VLDGWSELGQQIQHRFGDVGQEVSRSCFSSDSSLASLDCTPDDDGPVKEAKAKSGVSQSENMKAFKKYSCREVPQPQKTLRMTLEQNE